MGLFQEMQCLRLVLLRGVPQILHQRQYSALGEVLPQHEGPGSKPIQAQRNPTLCGHQSCPAVRTGCLTRPWEVANIISRLQTRNLNSIQRSYLVRKVIKGHIRFASFQSCCFSLCMSLHKKSPWIIRKHHASSREVKQKPGNLLLLAQVE